MSETLRQDVYLDMLSSILYKSSILDKSSILAAMSLVYLLRRVLSQGVISFASCKR